MALLTVLSMTSPWPTSSYQTLKYIAKSGCNKSMCLRFHCSGIYCYSSIKGQRLTFVKVDESFSSNVIFTEPHLFCFAVMLSTVFISEQLGKYIGEYCLVTSHCHPRNQGDQYKQCF